jgi:hypothetical protein
MRTRREHAFTCGHGVSIFFSSPPLPFIKQTKGPGERPASPVTIRPESGRYLGAKMDSHSVLAVLGPVSPPLAAYHYLRSTTDNLPSRCSRCGHLLLPGISHSRIVPSSATQRRKKARPSPNTPIVHCLRQSCATCGHVNNTHLSYFHTRNVIAPTPRLYPAVTVTPCTDGTDQCPPPDPPPQPSATPQLQPPIKSRKSRPKHKAGLQEMLARNRERQHEAANRGTSGLTTFLHSL